MEAFLNSRRKGKAGECAVQHLLEDRDWTIDRTRCGVTTDDMIATDPQGRAWSVECKRTKITDWPKFKAQAMSQAKARKLPWMLVVHIPGTSDYVILRQGQRCSLWSSGVSDE